MQPNGNYERNMSKVTVVDKRNGKLLYDKAFVQSGGQFQSVRTDPRAGAIDLIRSDLKISLRLDGSVASADPDLPQDRQRVFPVRAVGVQAVAPAVIGN